MRKTKPPVGWEHVKNCFLVPNELLDFDLPGGSIAVYIFLLRHADRRTGQCHPSTATMAKNLHYCRNTVASYVRLLEERGLIVTEHTKIITKNGIKKNGSLLYTIIPLQEVMEQHYEQQFNALERTTERRKAQAKLAEQLSAQKRSVLFPHSVITVDQNREAYQCGERKNNGITQPSGAATPRNSDAHERIAVPQAFCVLREHPRPRPKSGKVCCSDTRPRRGSEPRKTVRG